LLTKEQTKWLANPDNFKTYQDKYRQQDRTNALVRIEAERKRRDEIRRQYRHGIAQRRKDSETDSAWREKVGITLPSEDDYYVVEELVEEVLNETEEVEA